MQWSARLSDSVLYRLVSYYSNFYFLYSHFALINNKTKSRQVYSKSKFILQPTINHYSINCSIYHDVFVVLYIRYLIFLTLTELTWHFGKARECGSSRMADRRRPASQLGCCRRLLQPSQGTTTAPLLPHSGCTPERPSSSTIISKLAVDPELFIPIWLMECFGSVFGPTV
jgi:hypothetical protein